MFDLTMEDKALLRGLAWQPTYDTITESMLEEMIGCGFITQDEFERWGADQMSEACACEFEERLTLIQFRVSTNTPRQ